MMDFDEIWPQFAWVIEEMQNGMCFFEGYLPALGKGPLLTPLQGLIERAESHSFRNSTWSSDTTASDWDREYSAAEYVGFFESGRILTLHFDYEVRQGNTPLFLKLMFDRDESATALEIICYRDSILAASDPKQAIADAVIELRALKDLFRGDAVLLGPDTMDLPESATSYPREWLRID